jgi:hypothetical protein
MMWIGVTLAVGGYAAAVLGFKPEVWESLEKHRLPGWISRAVLGIKQFCETRKWFVFIVVTIICGLSVWKAVSDSKDEKAAKDETKATEDKLFSATELLSATTLRLHSTEQHLAEAMAETKQTRADLQTTVNGELKRASPGFFKLTEKFTTFGPDTWSLMMAFRISLRYTLRRLYEGSFPDRVKPHENGDARTVAIATMLGQLVQSGIIQKEMYNKLHEYDRTTFVVEWGIGQWPNPGDVDAVRKGGFEELEALQSIVGP